MAKTITILFGIIFLLVGLVGFVAPNFLGAHLSPAHNLIHLVSGAVSLFLGLRGSLAAVRTFCFVFGAVYLLLGIAGFLAGEASGRLLTVIPGVLVLGTVDHVIHAVVGLGYLFGGLLTSARYELRT